MDHSLAICMAICMGSVWDLYGDLGSQGAQKMGKTRDGQKRP